MYGIGQSRRKKKGEGYNMPLLTERQQIAILLSMTAQEGKTDERNSGDDVTDKSKMKKVHQSSVLGVNRPKNKSGETQLHISAMKGDLDGTKSLVKQGADVNCKDNAGWTPLHEACNYGHYKVAKVLIKSGAAVNVQGLEGDTPLHDASSNGHLKIVLLLLRHGANPQQKNDRGETALDVAEEPHIKEALKKFKKDMLAGLPKKDIVSPVKHKKSDSLPITPKKNRISNIADFLDAGDSDSGDIEEPIQKKFEIEERTDAPENVDTDKKLHHHTKFSSNEKAKTIKSKIHSSNNNQALRMKDFVVIKDGKQDERHKKKHKKSHSVSEIETTIEKCKTKKTHEIQVDKSKEKDKIVKKESSLLRYKMFDDESDSDESMHSETLDAHHGENQFEQNASKYKHQNENKMKEPVDQKGNTSKSSNHKSKDHIKQYDTISHSHGKQFSSKTHPSSAKEQMKDHSKIHQPIVKEHVKDLKAHTLFPKDHIKDHSKTHQLTTKDHVKDHSKTHQSTTKDHIKDHSKNHQSSTKDHVKDHLKTYQSTANEQSKDSNTYQSATKEQSKDYSKTHHSATKEQSKDSKTHQLVTKEHIKDSKAHQLITKEHVKDSKTNQFITKEQIKGHSKTHLQVSKDHSKEHLKYHSHVAKEHMKDHAKGHIKDHSKIHAQFPKEQTKDHSQSSKHHGFHVKKEKQKHGKEHEQLTSTTEKRDNLFKSEFQYSNDNLRYDKTKLLKKSELTNENDSKHTFKQNISEKHKQHPQLSENKLIKSNNSKERRVSFSDEADIQQKSNINEELTSSQLDCEVKINKVKSSDVHLLTGLKDTISKKSSEETISTSGKSSRETNTTSGKSFQENMKTSGKPSQETSTTSGKSSQENMKTSGKPSQEAFATSEKFSQEGSKIKHDPSDLLKKKAESLRKSQEEFYTTSKRKEKFKSEQKHKLKSDQKMYLPTQSTHSLVKEETALEKQDKVTIQSCEKHISDNVQPGKNDKKKHGAIQNSQHKDGCKKMKVSEVPLQIIKTVEHKVKKKERDKPKQKSLSIDAMKEATKISDSKGLSAKQNIEEAKSNKYLTNSVEEAHSKSDEKLDVLHSKEHKVKKHKRTKSSEKLDTDKLSRSDTSTPKNKKPAEMKVKSEYESENVVSSKPTSAEKLPFSISYTDSEPIPFSGMYSRDPLNLESGNSPETQAFTHDHLGGERRTLAGEEHIIECRPRLLKQMSPLHEPIKTGENLKRKLSSCNDEDKEQSKMKRKKSQDKTSTTDVTHKPKTQHDCKDADSKKKKDEEFHNIPKVKEVDLNTKVGLNNNVNLEQDMKKKRRKRSSESKEIDHGKRPRKISENDKANNNSQVKCEGRELESKAGSIIQHKKESVQQKKERPAKTEKKLISDTLQIKEEPKTCDSNENQMEDSFSKENENAVSCLLNMEEEESIGFEFANISADSGFNFTESQFITNENVDAAMASIDELESNLRQAAQCELESLPKSSNIEPSPKSSSTEPLLESTNREPLPISSSTEPLPKSTSSVTSLESLSSSQTAIPTVLNSNMSGSIKMSLSKSKPVVSVEKSVNMLTQISSSLGDVKALTSTVESVSSANKQLYLNKKSISSTDSVPTLTSTIPSFSSLQSNYPLQMTSNTELQVFASSHRSVCDDNILARPHLQQTIPSIPQHQNLPSPPKISSFTDDTKHIKSENIFEQFVLNDKIKEEHVEKDSKKQTISKNSNFPGILRNQQQWFPSSEFTRSVLNNPSLAHMHRNIFNEADYCAGTNIQPTNPIQITHNPMMFPGYNMFPAFQQAFSNQGQVKPLSVFNQSNQSAKHGYTNDPQNIHPFQQHLQQQARYSIPTNTRAYHPPQTSSNMSPIEKSLEGTPKKPVLQSFYSTQNNSISNELKNETNISKKSVMKTSGLKTLSVNTIPKVAVNENVIQGFRLPKEDQNKFHLKQVVASNTASIDQPLETPLDKFIGQLPNSNTYSSISISTVTKTNQHDHKQIQSNKKSTSVQQLSSVSQPDNSKSNQSHVSQQSPIVPSSFNNQHTVIVSQAILNPSSLIQPQATSVPSIQVKQSRPVEMSSRPVKQPNSSSCPTNVSSISIKQPNSSSCPTVVSCIPAKQPDCSPSTINVSSISVNPPDSITKLTNMPTIPIKQPDSITRLTNVSSISIKQPDSSSNHKNVSSSQHGNASSTQAIFTVKKDHTSQAKTLTQNETAKTNTPKLAWYPNTRVIQKSGNNSIKHDNKKLKFVQHDSESPSSKIDSNVATEVLLSSHLQPIKPIVTQQQQNTSICCEETSINSQFSFAVSTSFSMQLKAPLVSTSIQTQTSQIQALKENNAISSVKLTNIKPNSLQKSMGVLKQSPQMKPSGGDEMFKPTLNEANNQPIIESTAQVSVQESTIKPTEAKSSLKNQQIPVTSSMTCKLENVSDNLEQSQKWKPSVTSHTQKNTKIFSSHKPQEKPFQHLQPVLKKRDPSSTFKKKDSESKHFKRTKMSLSHKQHSDNSYQSKHKFDMMKFDNYSRKISGKPTPQEKTDHYKFATSTEKQKAQEFNQQTKTASIPLPESRQFLPQKPDTNVVNKEKKSAISKDENVTPISTNILNAENVLPGNIMSTIPDKQIVKKFVAVIPNVISVAPTPISTTTTLSTSQLNVPLSACSTGNSGIPVTYKMSDLSNDNLTPSFSPPQADKNIKSQFQVSANMPTKPSNETKLTFEEKGKQDISPLQSTIHKPHSKEDMKINKTKSEDSVDAKNLLLHSQSISPLLIPSVVKEKKSLTSTEVKLNITNNTASYDKQSTKADETKSVSTISTINVAPQKNNETVSSQQCTTVQSVTAKHEIHNTESSPLSASKEVIPVEIKGPVQTSKANTNELNAGLQKPLVESEKNKVNSSSFKKQSGEVQAGEVINNLQKPLTDIIVENVSANMQKSLVSEFKEKNKDGGVIVQKVDDKSENDKELVGVVAKLDSLHSSDISQEIRYNKTKHEKVDMEEKLIEQKESVIQKEKKEDTILTPISTVQSTDILSNQALVKESQELESEVKSNNSNASTRKKNLDSETATKEAFFPHITEASSCVIDSSNKSSDKPSDNISELARKETVIHEPPKQVKSFAAEASSPEKMTVKLEPVSDECSLEERVNEKNKKMIADAESTKTVNKGDEDSPENKVEGGSTENNIDVRSAENNVDLRSAENKVDGKSSVSKHDNRESKNIEQSFDDILIKSEQSDRALLSIPLEENSTNDFNRMNIVSKDAFIDLISPSIRSVTSDLHEYSDLDMIDTSDLIKPVSSESADLLSSSGGSITLKPQVDLLRDNRSEKLSSDEIISKVADCILEMDSTPSSYNMMSTEISTSIYMSPTIASSFISTVDQTISTQANIAASLTNMTSDLPNTVSLPNLASSLPNMSSTLQNAASLPNIVSSLAVTNISDWQNAHSIYENDSVFSNDESVLQHSNIGDITQPIFVNTSHPRIPSSDEKLYSPKHIHDGEKLYSPKPTPLSEKKERTVDVEPCSIGRSLISVELPDVPERNFSENKGSNSASPVTSVSPVSSTIISSSESKSVVSRDNLKKLPIRLRSWRQAIEQRCVKAPTNDYKETNIDSLLQKFKFDDDYKELEQKARGNEEVMDLLLQHASQKEKLKIMLVNEVARVSSNCKLMCAGKGAVSATTVLYYQQDEYSRKLDSTLSFKKIASHTPDIQKLYDAKIEDLVDKFQDLLGNMVSRQKIELDTLEQMLDLDEPNFQPIETTPYQRCFNITC